MFEKKGKIVSEILRLRQAVREYTLECETMRWFNESMKDFESMCKTKAYSYHIMPVSNITSIFNDYAAEFRENCEWITDERFGWGCFNGLWDEVGRVTKRVKEEIEEEGGIYYEEFFSEDFREPFCRKGELPRARCNRVYLICDDVYKVEEGWVFILRDPYGSFCTQPLDYFDVHQVRNMKQSIVLAIAETKYDVPFTKESFYEFWYKAVEENDRKKAVYDRRKPIFRTYNGKQYRQINVSLSPTQYRADRYTKKRYSANGYLESIFNFRNVGTESEVVIALDRIADISDRAHGVRFKRRVSLTELKVLMDNHDLYWIMYCNGQLCFSKEHNHPFPGEMIEENGEKKVASEEDAFVLRYLDQLDDDYEHLRLRYTMFHANLFGTDELELERIEDIKPSADESGLDCSRRKLCALRENLQKEVDKLRQKYEDSFVYAKNKLLFEGYIYEDDADFTWFHDLYAHPDYYTRWKGTFFDTQHEFAMKLLNTDGCRNYLNFIKGRPLMWHCYRMKNGAKSAFEDLDIYSFERRLRNGAYDLDSDYCIRYIAFCDSASSIDGLATVHLIDPTGEEYFNNLSLPPEIVNASVGHMISLTCSYNYYEEGEFRMMKYQVLPYTLTEQLGEYKEDELVVSWDIEIFKKEFPEFDEECEEECEDD